MSFVTRLATTIALCCYQPLIDGFAWYGFLFGNPWIRASRLVSPFLVAIFSCLLWRRHAWWVAPLVVICSGLAYNSIEVAYRGDRDTGENVVGTLILALFAMVLGILMLLSNKGKLSSSN